MIEIEPLGSLPYSPLHALVRYAVRIGADPTYPRLEATPGVGRGVLIHAAAAGNGSRAGR